MAAGERNDGKDNVMIVFWRTRYPWIGKSLRLRYLWIPIVEKDGRIGVSSTNTCCRYFAGFNPER